MYVPQQLFDRDDVSLSGNGFPDSSASTSSTATFETARQSITSIPRELSIHEDKKLPQTAWGRLQEDDMESSVSEYEVEAKDKAKYTLEYPRKLTYCSRIPPAPLEQAGREFKKKYPRNFTYIFSQAERDEGMRKLNATLEEFGDGNIPASESQEISVMELENQFALAEILGRCSALWGENWVEKVFEHQNKYVGQY